MATQSPFSWLGEVLQDLPRPPIAPPPWAVHEAQHRLVLFLNHVLMQEPEAMSRLQRLCGRTMLLQWQDFQITLQATPAGLLDLASPAATPDLVVTLIEPSALNIAQGLMQGDKPAIRIEGDVELATQVSWLSDNVRWDLEEDLSRLLGDTAAHTLVQFARAARAALIRFAAGAVPPTGRSSAT